MNICTNLRIYIYPVIVAEFMKYICILFVNVIIVHIFHLIFIVSKIENILMIIIYKISECF